MSFIAKNPISTAELTSSPSPPQKGARGIFAKEDGWYDIDDKGNVTRLATSAEIKEISENAGLVVEETINSGVAKSYVLKQGEIVIASIDIPLDMVVSGGVIETYTNDNLPDDVSVAGTYIVLTIANSSSDKLYININDLVEINEIADDLTTDDSTKVLSAKQGKILNDTKVDKVEGKGLSANDFTDEEKDKLFNLTGEKGEGDYSAQSGYNAQAVGHYTSAEGYNTIAGIKGYFFSAINFEGEEILDENGVGTGTYRPKITLTKEQPDDIMQAPVPEPFEIGFADGDELTITNDDKYPRCCKITAVDNNIITVDALPFKSIVNMAGDVGVDDYQVFCSDKPLAGEVNLGFYAHAEGEDTWALERASHAEGRLTRAEGQYAHVEGRETTALYIGHAEGKGTFAGGSAHAEGVNTTADGGQGAHAEGVKTHAAGTNGSHAEGYKTVASGVGAHAEGHSANASGDYSHAENKGITRGQFSHAEGFNTEANGQYTHTEGYYTIASSTYQHVQGKFNVEDVENKYADIIGNGTGSKASQRKNIQTTDWNGNFWTAGNVYIGGTSQDDKNAKKVAVEPCINSSIDASSEIQLEICDNCILSYGIINTALIATLPEEYQYIGFISGLYFTTPSVIPENYTQFDDKIYFKGDSTQGDGTKSTFVPEADMRYTIVFSFDGNMMVGYVSGVPAPPVSEVTE